MYAAALGHIAVVFEIVPHADVISDAEGHEMRPTAGCRFGIVLARLVQPAPAAGYPVIRVLDAGLGYRRRRRLHEECEAMDRTMGTSPPSAD